MIKVSFKKKLRIFYEKKSSHTQKRNCSLGKKHKMFIEKKLKMYENVTKTLRKKSNHRKKNRKIVIQCLFKKSETNSGP